jgi:hypothetical protein
MPHATVASDIAQSRDVLSYLPTELTSHNIVAIDDLCDPTQLILAQLVGLRRPLDPSFLQNQFRRMPTNSWYVRQ